MLMSMMMPMPRLQDDDVGIYKVAVLVSVLTQNFKQSSNNREKTDDSSKRCWMFCFQNAARQGNRPNFM